MEISRQSHLHIDDMSAVGEARRLTARLCRAMHAGESLAGNAAIAVTEAATNLVKHARYGEMFLRPLGEGGGEGIELLSIDRGPGIENLAESLRDGFSTSGSPGSGLGAIRRLSSEFDIFSSPGSGTVMMSRVSAVSPKTAGPHPLFNAGAVSLPIGGEEECGDDWALAVVENRLSVFVVDGIGHGLDAVEASRLAVGVFSRYAAEGPEPALRRVDDALKSTRGAVAAIAEIDPGAGKVRYAGVGNIAAAIISAGESRSMVSHNGTLGQDSRKVQEFTYPWPQGALLIMSSDGISTRWQLSASPGLEYRHPSVIAGVLYRDHSRKRDDVTVLAVRTWSNRGDLP